MTVDPDYVPPEQRKTMPEKDGVKLMIYDNGPYVVLGDMSTFCSGGSIVYLSDKGQQQLEDSVDMKYVDDSEITIITVDSLLDAYNQVHGTKL